MSDNWLRLIPKDPNFIPEPAKQMRLIARFAQIAPQAGEVKVQVYESVQFFDCGGNFERVLCPACGLEIQIQWWKDRMDEDFEAGFKLALYSTPCCDTQYTLQDLVYEWPQGFGRFVLEAMNPNIGKVKGKDRQDLEDIVGTKLRVIYQHL